MTHSLLVRPAWIAALCSLAIIENADLSSSLGTSTLNPIIFFFVVEIVEVVVVLVLVLLVEVVVVLEVVLIVEVVVEVVVAVVDAAIAEYVARGPEFVAVVVVEDGNVTELLRIKRFFIEPG